jgi:hypothetical protein
MRGMRSCVLFLCAVLLVLPFSASALVRPPFSATKCPKGASSEPQPTVRQVFNSKIPQAEAEKWLNTAISCPNACYDLAASLTLLNDGVQVEVTATDKCKYNDKLPNDPAQVPKRGCLKGETEPVIKIATKEVYSR